MNKEVFRSLGVLTIAKQQKIPRWQLVFIVLIGRRYVSRHLEELTPFPGIKDQLVKLSQEHTLGIVTSNSKKNAITFLDSHDMLSLFSLVESKVNYFGKAQKLSQVIDKHHIQKNECVYVGDETRDIQAAKTIGIGAVAVTWGFENKNILSESQPHITVTKVSSLYQNLSHFFSQNHNGEYDYRIHNSK